MTGTPYVLEASGLSKEFAGFQAVRDVELRVTEGHVHALVGPNGAGKTTLFNLLTGVVKPTKGRIVFAGHDIAGLSPDKIAARGIARSFQVTSLFPSATLLEHVELALQATTNTGHKFWRSDRTLGRFQPRAMELLSSVGLARAARQTAGSLPYGQKRALELAVALALDPKLLLLDEPTAGMGLEDVDRTIDLVRRVRDGRTVVMVEHNMSVVGSLADRVTVLQRGSVLAEGTYDEVRADERVITAYLGAPSA